MGLLPSAPAEHTVRPDADKLARSLLDAISDAGVWRDDAQVAELHVRKVYGDRPGVRVRLVELEARPSVALSRRSPHDVHPSRPPIHGGTRP